MSGKRVIICGLLVLLANGGTVSAGEPETGARCKPGAKGIIFVLGGVGGYDPLALSAQLFLPRAGVSHDIWGFKWTHGLGQILKDLQDTRHLHRKADELAELILAYRQRQPERPIYLMANSGGTGLALLTAERLPPQTLERIILLASAVSPEYDLRCALRATRGEIINHYSPLDRLVLHWGTWQFGTTDRHYVASAGCTGFVVPRELSPEDRELYDRLVQIPWEPRFMVHGHGGGHIGVHSPCFLMNEVAPWLRD